MLAPVAGKAKTTRQKPSTQHGIPDPPAGPDEQGGSESDGEGLLLLEESEYDGEPVPKLEARSNDNEGQAAKWTASLCSTLLKTVLR